MTKSALKNSILNAAETGGLLDLIQKTGRVQGPHLYVLTYHRVEDLDHNAWLDPDGISATPRQFEAQMKLIADRYHPVSAEEVLTTARGGPALPKDAVLVTVDDGYRDFKDVIFPICRQYGIRPILFQPTAFVGTGKFWWDQLFQIIHHSGADEIYTPVGHFPIGSRREKLWVQYHLIQEFKRMPFEKVTTWVDTEYAARVHLAEQPPYDTLTWDELRQLNQAGVTIASHTHTHPIMTKIPLEEARQQVRLSQAIIERELGYALPIFAFPDGKPHAFNQPLVDMLYEEGYEMLFLMVDGRAVIQTGTNKNLLPRLAVWQSQSLPQFHLRLTPWNGIRNLALGKRG